jgi:Arc/MetJ-type ribon-helix-helix transcriptional regulator
MTTQSRSARIPPEMRREIDAKIGNGAFANFRALAGWLKRNGYNITRAGRERPRRVSNDQTLERKLETIKHATEQARALLAAPPDDECAMNDVLIRLVQQINFDILVQLDAAGVDELDSRTLAAITRSVATVARAAVEQRRWVAEARERLKAQLAAADAKVAAVAKQGGLSDAAATHIRNALLDIKV